MEKEIRDLPPPEVQAQQQSERLIELIRERIEQAGGKITFAEYMSLALYAPGLGYYSAGTQKFGRSGDFVTAPEISPLFSRCVARQCQPALTELETRHAVKPVILEVGGGSGVMAADVLAELERLGCLPTEYQILELSADLQQRQAQTIAAKVPHLKERVRWLTSLPSKPFNGVVLANELLDAMPVHRFSLPAHGVPREAYVSWQHERLAWQFSEPSSDQVAERITAIANFLGEDRPREFVSEVNLAAEAWVKTMAHCLHTGLVLIIDYGFPRQEYYHPQRSAGT
ncbi:MAG: hypothetical protein AMJ53_05400, partial [Gammaproteobacteria bacterium SG8_11]